MRGPRTYPLGLMTCLCGTLAAGGGWAETAPDLPDLSAALDAVDASDTEASADWEAEETARPLTLTFEVGIDNTELSGPVTDIIEQDPNKPYAALVVGLDTNILPGLSARSRYVLLSYDEEESHRLHDGELRWQISPALRLSLGKTYPAWSFSELVHVLDPSIAEAGRVDPDDFTEDYAHPSVELAYSAEGFDLSVLAMSEGRDLRDLDTSSHIAALRFGVSVGNANITTQVLGGKDRGTELGFGVDWSAGQTVWAIEAHWAETRRLDPVNLFANGAAFDTDANRDAWQVMLAARRPVGSNWQGEALLYHNGHGYSDTEWSDFLTGEERILDAMDRFDFTHAGHLSDTSSVHAGQFLRQNYVGASLSSTDGLLPWGLTLGSYAGLDDGGLFPFLNVSRDLGKGAELALEASGGFGPSDSEFSRRPDSFSVTFRMEF